jgi:site-specific DNA recombinase
MLQNRIYRGEILHQGTAYPGQHKAIIDPELWQIVQDKLAANRQERALAVGAEAPSLLAGLIVDAGGNWMTPIHATKRAKRYPTTSRRRFSLGITREPRKGCAFQRVILRRWCSTG